MSDLRTLAIDIGGSGIKAALLDENGHVVSDRERVPTPARPIAPDALLHAIDEAIAPLGAFDRASVGFPGYVRDGRVVTAPNLGTETLGGFDLQQALSDHWGKPVRVLNDADVQGFGAITGEGIEMILTLGTGAGTAIFRDGEVMPHLELAHHPISGKKTYDEYVGNNARRKKGKKAWNKRVAKVIDVLRVVVRFDHLYIGGGNAKDVNFPLPHDVSVVPNTDGLTGGIELWREMPVHIAAGTGAVSVPAGETTAPPLDPAAGRNRSDDAPHSDDLSPRHEAPPSGETLA
ncbi:MAG TPA: ROK family protein [Stellaceae bacterium]|nr:ROK family protein [Stellaceae bacterium]